MITEVPRERYQFPVREIDYDANYYFAGAISGQDYGYAHVQQISYVGYIHLYITTWNRRMLSELLSDFNELKHILYTRGIRLLMGLYPIDGLEGKWVKLIKLLGFSKPIEQVNVEGHDCLRVMMEVCDGD